ncbi:hypothetical protein CHARACLAT_012787 [Characodon lateralis]|uniref:Uncharacterized protein n=1 Tax=Characodon lateralis TaxID=208331 RepID=A0ABU7ECG3_9TELE|nr:hypothetical protein [Characodon lateralis]
MEWKPRGRRQLVFSLGMLDLLLKVAVESLWSPVSLVSCSEEFGNSSLDNPALSVHSASNSKPHHQPACPPSVNSPTTVEFPRRKETQAKKYSNSPHILCTSHQLQATVEKYLLLPPRPYQELNPCDDRQV